MNNNISYCIEMYRKQLAQGDIQRAYTVLTKYVAELKSKFPKQYLTGNISFGYLDYTYFPFFNDYLRNHKLRFGIVLNHEKIQIELWLMGQNAPVQKEYWEILKDTNWNKNINEMPQYSVLEVCLEDNIDFEKKEEMTQVILERAMSLSEEIQMFLQSRD
ncbi:DUF7000 family protein [Lacrimispora brassicae]